MNKYPPPTPENAASVHEGLKKAVTELLVLFFLHQKEMYTYELIQEIKKQSQGVFAFNTLYIAIYRLQEKGFIRESRKVASEENRIRVYFALTPDGESYLQSALVQCRSTIQALYQLLEQDGQMYPKEEGGV